MSFIPEDAKWYVADLVLEFRPEDSETAMVHVNSHLIRADSPDEAYEKALAHGQESEDRYVNARDVEVTVTFRGLQDLQVVFDELEDGAELCWYDLRDQTEADIKELVSSKEELGVFMPIESDVTLDYLPRDLDPEREAQLRAEEGQS